MGLAKHALYFAAHPIQLLKIIQWRLSHTPLHKRDKQNESDTTKLCYEFLERTSRSFSPVIQALHPELRMTICIFYLVLRGLDTIEDDPSLPFSRKESLLRNFHTFIENDGWTYNGNRPEEKHREVLVQFDKVIVEYKKLKPAYQAIIKDITRQMGNGMADFIQKAESDDVAIQTVEDYDLYCWYVAGVVGEGLTRLIVEAEMGDPVLEEEKHLYKSMGLYLQKNNVLRDIHNDFEDNRRWWPKEIWSKYVDSFEDLLKPENLDAALCCSSEMVLNALKHTCDCIFYLERVHEQSLFEFAAIPQTMALATYELCFRNPAIFQKNVKLAKGDAFELIIESTQGINGVCSVFHRYAQRIQLRNDPADRNYKAINDECEKIKEFAEHVASKQGGKTLATQQKSSSSQTAVIGVVVATVLVLVASWLLQGTDGVL